MSIAFMRKDDVSGRDLYVPICTQEAFVRDWLPVARDLGLVLVPMFEFGVELDVPGMKDALAELWLMIEHLRRHPRGEDFEERIGRLRQALVDAVSVGASGVFVG